MWSGKNYLNQDGIPIALLIPKKSARKQHTNIKKEKKKDHSDDDVDGACKNCFIGGSPKFYSMDSNKTVSEEDSTASRCGICEKPLHLLIQIYAPIMDEQNLHRTLYVFACDRCCDTIPGVTIRCLRSQQQQHQEQITKSNSLTFNPTATVPIEITKADMHNYDDNYWGYDDTIAANKDDPKTLSLDEDIESILFQLEQQQPKLKLPNRSSDEKPSCFGTETNNFFTKNPYPMYELEWMDEPPPPLTTFNRQCSQVEQMVQRYLEEEEDQELVTTLQQLNIQNSENYLVKDEEYDDHSTSQTSGTTSTNENDLWFSFIERIKRMPEQVLRYGYDGELLWPTNIALEKDKKKERMTPTFYNPSIPKCICGAERKFEFQLMPYLLHLLNISKSNQDADKKSATTLPEERWGTIGIYSCSHSCDNSREEYVTVCKDTL